MFDINRSEEQKVLQGRIWFRGYECWGGSVLLEHMESGTLLASAGGAEKPGGCI